MTFDRAKILAEGGTFHDEKNPLVECTPFHADRIAWEGVAESGAAPATIKEDVSLPKRMVIEGTFQRFMPAGADPNKYRNANRRIYTMERVGKKVLDPAGDVQKRIAERAMIGHLEHPESGTTDLNKGAILITKVWAESDGTIKGRAIVYNTPEGQRIQEYVTTGTKIGISSRGTGTVDANGYVCEDFVLETWDVVYNPSTAGANPTAAAESAAESREPPVHAEQVLESAAPVGKTPSQDTPMTVAERIAKAKESASRLIAIDPKRLTVEQRKALAADVLNLRVAIAEEFAGEKRAVADGLLKQLSEALAALESLDSSAVGGFQDAPIPGQGDGAGIPGNTWDMLNKAVAAAGSARMKAVESLKSIADLIAANLGKLPEIQAAAEAVVYDKKARDDADGDKKDDGDKKADGDKKDKDKDKDKDKGEKKGETVELPEAVRTALIDARDEIIKLTERDEAASAIIREMTDRLAKASAELAVATAEVESLVSENAGLKAAAEKSAEMIASLTSAKNAAKVTESAAPAAASAARKPLYERLAPAQPKSEDDAALPPKGSKVESVKDAGQASPKAAPLRENASRGAAMAATALAKLNAGQ